MHVIQGREGQSTGVASPYSGALIGEGRGNLQGWPHLITGPQRGGGVDASPGTFFQGPPEGRSLDKNCMTPPLLDPCGP